MFSTRYKKWKREVALCAIMFCVVALCGCGGSGNYLSREGFVSANVPVLLNEDSTGLREEISHVVMTLTSAQATALIAKFKTQSRFYPSITPSDMPPVGTPNVLWKPQVVKKYWSGRFERGAGSYPYYCTYVFDVSNPAKVTLYFFALRSYD